ncbi:MAG TPA: ThuA domain-containing protein [Opitutaceae bacterium]|nr:ThuA domain-containing protein [Opitutaceae bacterium]
MKLTPLLVLVFSAILSATAVAADAPKKIVFIAGRASHGPGEHEHRAGSMLLQKCLAGIPGITTEVHTNGWPTKLQEDGTRVDDHAALAGADAIIIYSDGGRGHPALVRDHLAVLGEHMQRGTGLGLIHYAVEPTLEKGQKEFLDWVGGAFEIKWSVNPHWQAEFAQLPGHAVSRGVKPFSTNDEWYFNLRFRDAMKGITPVLTAVPPASTMSRADGDHEGNPGARAAVAKGTPQTVMWVSERAGNGRGFGFTGGHFHVGWKDDNQRKLVLNAILWIAHLDVPVDGVASTVTAEDLAANLDAKRPRPAPAAPAAPATPPAPVAP